MSQRIEKKRTELAAIIRERRIVRKGYIDKEVSDEVVKELLGPGTLFSSQKNNTITVLFFILFVIPH